jgi:diguanylate cyclase (GGDEF)-like protein
LLLLFAWIQNSESRAVAWWGSAYVLRAGSIALFGMFGSLPDVMTIDVANAMLLTSFAVTWTGARLFIGGKVNIAYILAGAAIWLVACRVPDIANSPPIRSMLGASIIAAYTWLAAADIWFSESPLVSRIPASALLFTHGALFLLRTPLGALLPHSAGTEAVMGSVWLTALSSEALLLTIAVAFILMAMAKERTASMHRTAALVDPLTGVWNRRGFMSANERVQGDPASKAVPAAVLFIDLDNFKSINDRFGHALGDRVIQVLATTIKSLIRSTDYVGRFGGEEFAAVLYSVSHDAAIGIAERIRTAFADRANVIDGTNVAATVSIGLVLQEDGPGCPLVEMLKRADSALYRAKERGRNCVELSGSQAFGIADAVPEPIEPRLARGIA